MRKGKWAVLKKYLIAVILLAFATACILITDYFWQGYIPPIGEDDIKHVKSSKAKKLMIVAHPDDETLWGGAHLIEDDYFVVCVTNGNNKVRAEEFKNILEATSDDGLIMKYPDKVKGERSEWTDEYEDIYEDLEKIIEAKDWEVIVTHNPNGEYGHIHHTNTNKIVTDIVCEEENLDRLYYFGNYYKKKTLDEMEVLPKSCDEETLKKKEQVLKLYESQENTVKKLSHMNPYENWTSYSEW